MTNRSAFLQALQIAWQFGYTITIPLVLLALLGRFLDQKLNTHPWMFIGGVILSIFLSSFGLVLQFKRIVRSMEASDPRKPSPPPQPKT